MIFYSDMGSDVLEKCPEVVNYLLETYANNEEIPTAYSDVIYCKNLADKTATDFVEQVWTTERQCRSIFSERMLMSIFVDGLSPRMQALIRSPLATSKKLLYT